MSKQSSEGRALSRYASRLAAVQALYQITESSSEAELVIQEFINFRIGKEIEGVVYPSADESHFKRIVNGVCSKRLELDELIQETMSEEWKIDRVSTLMLSILRAGSFELLEMPDVPSKVVINEYINLAHDFFPSKDASFVNAALDRMAKIQCND